MQTEKPYSVLFYRNKVLESLQGQSEVYFTSLEMLLGEDWNADTVIDDKGCPR